MSRRFLIWYWSATGGGGSQFAVNLSRRLAKRFGPGAVRLSLHADDPLLARSSAEPDFETVAAAVTTSRGQPLRTLLALADSGQVLAEHARDCDVVIVPMNFASAAPLALSVRQPLVYFAHDPVPHPGDYAALGQRATQALLVSRASRVVALSRYSATELARLGVAERKLVTTPLGAVYEPHASISRGEGPVRFLFAGRMLAYKGVDILADALTRLSHRDDWRLTVAGSGPTLDAAAARRFEMAQVERVARNWHTENALEAAIAGCDIVLAPYRSATQSGVLAQALAHGKPCVVTPIGGLCEQVGEGDAGWIAERADAPAFAVALNVVLDDRERVDAKAQAARALAHSAWAHDYWAWLKEI